MRENEAERGAVGRLTLVLALGTALLLLAAPAPSDAAGRSLEIGFGDNLYTSSKPGERATALDETVAVGGSVARLPVSWRAVAPRSRPQGFDPTDPGDPNYDWSKLDAPIRDARAAGLQVILLVTSAPDWAEGANRPDNAPDVCQPSAPQCAAAGTWKPDPRELADFGTALARRYSGSFGSLPRVRDYQLWAEPNLENHLTPQWSGKKPKSPEHYAKMLNRFYRAIHGVKRSNRVVAGGTAPYGDARGAGRMRPMMWWRELMCLRGRQRLKTTGCARKAKFDVLAHHPINTSGGPEGSAIHPDDVSTSDLRHLVRALRFAERKGTVKPKGRHPVWATEIWWESKPPDPAVGNPSLRKQARWYSESLYLLRKQGASMVLLAQVQDDPYDGNPGRFTSNFQSGVYFADGRPKPAAAAIRFPFVPDRKRGRKVLLWGKAPAAGKLIVEQRRSGKGARRVARIRVKAGEVFRERVRLGGSRPLRARVGGVASPYWKAR